MTSSLRAPAVQPPGPVQRRCPRRPETRAILAALPVFGATVLGEMKASGDPAVPASVVSWGFPIVRTASLTGGFSTDPRPGVVGSLAAESPDPVLLLPVPPEGLSVEEWAILGLSPVEAASVLGAVAPGESLLAVLDIDGDALAIVATAQAVPACEADVIVSHTSSTGPGQTFEDALREFFRILEELRRRLYEPASPQPPPQPPGSEDPGGEW